MAEEQRPFEDVVRSADGFSIPELKFRELVFVGALRVEGEHYVRDPTRPMPLFRDSELFPEHARFRIERAGGRVWLRHEPP